MRKAAGPLPKMDSRVGNYQGRKKYPAGSGESWVCKEMKERGVYD